MYSFRAIRIVDSNRTQYYCFLTAVPVKKKCSFLYIVLRFKYIQGLILKFGRNFPIDVLWDQLHQFQPEKGRFIR